MDLNRGTIVKINSKYASDYSDVPVGSVGIILEVLFDADNELDDPQHCIKTKQAVVSKAFTDNNFFVGPFRQPLYSVFTVNQVVFLYPHEFVIVAK